MKEGGWERERERDGVGRECWEPQRLRNPSSPTSCITLASHFPSLYLIFHICAAGLIIHSHGTEVRKVGIQGCNAHKVLGLDKSSGGLRLPFISYLLSCGLPLPGILHFICWNIDWRKASPGAKEYCSDWDPLGVLIIMPGQ